MHQRILDYKSTGFLLHTFGLLCRCL